MADFFNSLTCTLTTVTIDISAGSLTQDGAAVTSVVDGPFEVTGGATLAVAGGTFTSNGATTLSGANLTAETGGKMLFPDATSYTGSNGANTTISATGSGSKISLTALTTFAGGGYDGYSGTQYATSIQATSGGEIDLAGAIGINPNASNNIITLDNTGGILGVAGITSLTSTNLTDEGGESLSFTKATSLTAVNLTASGGSQLLFPDATSYTGSNGANTTISATGSGSKISLTALTTFAGGGYDGYSGTQYATSIQATSGGEIDISGQISGFVQFTSSAGGIISITGSGGLSSLTVSGTGSILKLNPGPQIYTVTSLSVTGGGTLDLTDNELLINYGSNADPIDAIAAEIASGYNGGAWNGTGIISSAARTNPTYALGYADSADPNNPANLAADQIEVMYTLQGDANLDGKVNGVDFNLMSAAFDQAITAGWDYGDFNYDGKVNGNDFVLLADNFNQFASQSAAAISASANGTSTEATQTPASVSVSDPADVISTLLGKQKKPKHP
jgi:hypothetical protein